MTKPAYFALGAMALSLPMVLASSPQPRYVWPSRCITVQQTVDTQLDAPLKDGQPDMSHAVVRKMNVKYRPDCGQLEMR